MSTIDPSHFFKRKRNTSEIKSEILNKYFNAWCGILLHGQKKRTIDTVIYIDLYSGQGLYEDGQPSTPIKILNSIYKSKGTFLDLNQCVKTFFNDSQKSIIDKLVLNISNLSYYSELVHKPMILNEVANQNLLANLLNNNHPSLTFIDPFGYSYSQQMLLHSVQRWGSDLFMLFNFNRIRSAVLNSKVDSLMVQIFGERLDLIKEYYKKISNTHKREEFIIEQFEAIFKDKKYLTFKFRINFPDKNQTSHYLIFVSKVRIAYIRIKEIMQRYSDLQEDGVPLFGANQKPLRLLTPEYARLLKFSILNLIKDLSTKAELFNNKTIQGVYEEHNIGTNYIKENYKKAFEELGNQGVVELLDKNRKSIKTITYTCIINYKEWPNQA